MQDANIASSFFLIFTGAAVVATAALYTRQPLIIAYIALGALLGPYGFKLIEHPEFATEISEIGIIFLLFLLGLDMQPRSLARTIKETSFVALISSVIFALVGWSIALAFGFQGLEAVIIGLCCMFSSTIIGIKLLPTTVLHHKRSGELMVGLLLLQDIIAITTLLALTGMNTDTSAIIHYGKALFALPLLGLMAWLAVKYMLIPLLERFDRFQEYIFLLAIGWCLGFAELAHLAGLSLEIGAFIAGVSLASHPISLYIAQSLKPLRDFFLVIFFFSLGANFNLELLNQVLFASLVLASTMLIIKPLVFRLLFGRIAEKKQLAWDLGFRLGQISEFSLLLAFLASSMGVLSVIGAHVVQATAILTFAVSSYIVVLNFPSPVAVKDELRRD